MLFKKTIAAGMATFLLVGSCVPAFAEANFNG